jgi:hypothetical protein
MLSDFNFIGFTPNENLKEKAQQELDRLMDLAPYGAMAVALLEFEHLARAILSLQGEVKRAQAVRLGVSVDPQCIFLRSQAAHLHRIPRSRMDSRNGHPRVSFLLLC